MCVVSPKLHVCQLEAQKHKESEHTHKHVLNREGGGEAWRSSYARAEPCLYVSDLSRETGLIVVPAHFSQCYLQLGQSWTVDICVRIC